MRGGHLKFEHRTITTNINDKGVLETIGRRPYATKAKYLKKLELETTWL